MRLLVAILILAGGLLNSYRFVVSTAYEGFEGTGAPTNWSAFPGSDTPDWDYTAAPLAGAQSLFLQDSVANFRTVIWNFTDADQIWLAFKFKTSADPAADAACFYIQTDADATLATFHIATNGVMAPYVDAVVGNTVIDFTPGTAYRVKVRYVRGTGSNETLEIWAATEASGAWGTSQIQTNGTSTAQPGRALVDTFQTFNFNLTIDNALYKTSDILWSELN